MDRVMPKASEDYRTLLFVGCEYYSLAQKRKAWNFLSAGWFIAWLKKREPVRNLLPSRGFPFCFTSHLGRAGDAGRAQDIIRGAGITGLHRP
jgi:hypothetical protein